MDVITSIEQVAGILHRADLKFDTWPDGDGYCLQFEPAEAVFLSFTPWGEGSVAIAVTSPVLQDISADSVGAALVQSRLQELNQRHRFVKFLWTDDTLLAVHDLLGDTLRAGELLNVVLTVAACATRVADELEDETGGTRYRAAVERDEDEIDFDFEEVEDE